MAWLNGNKQTAHRPPQCRGFLSTTLKLIRTMAKFTKTDYFRFIDKTFADMRALIERKNNDYTAGSQETDPFRNFREAEQFGIDPLAGLSNRMNDKFNRIKSFCNTGNLAVKTEGVEDAFHDMIGYSLLALGMLEEAKTDGKQSELEFPKGGFIIPGSVVTKSDMDAMCPPKPDEPLGYYYLRGGELIELGDEYEAPSGTWKATRHMGNPVEVNSPRYRRFVPRDDEPEPQRVALP